MVVINIKSEDTRNSSTGMKIGIGLSCGAIVVAAIFVGLFLLRRRKLQKVEDIDEEIISIADDTTNTFVHTNPLINLLSEDDPFGDEFD